MFHIICYNMFNFYKGIANGVAFPFFYALTKAIQPLIQHQLHLSKENYREINDKRNRIKT